MNKKNKIKYIPKNTLRVLYIYPIYILFGPLSYYVTIKKDKHFNALRMDRRAVTSSQGLGSGLRGLPGPESPCLSYCVTIKNLRDSLGLGTDRIQKLSRENSASYNQTTTAGLNPIFEVTVGVGQGPSGPFGVPKPHHQGTT